MAISYSALKGKEIKTFSTKKTIGMVSDIVIDPTTGAVLAILSLDNKDIFPATSVIAWEPQLLVENFNKKKYLKELTLIHNTINHKIPLIDNLVITERGKELGKVRDFSFDEITLMLTTISIERNILIIPLEKRIIPRSSIVEIGRSKIVVKDDLAKLLAPVKGIFAFKEKSVNAEPV